METKMDFRIIFKTIKYLKKINAIVNVEYDSNLGTGRLSGEFKFKVINNEFKLFFIGKHFEMPINTIKYGNINNAFKITSKKNGSFINTKLFNACANAIQSNISKNQQKYFNKLYPSTLTKAMKIFKFCQDHCDLFIGNENCKLTVKNIVSLDDNSQSGISTRIAKNTNRIDKYEKEIKRLYEQINKLKIENDILMPLL